MATKKAKATIKTTTVDFSNSIEKIRETAKTVNNEVVDTTFEVIADLRMNGTQLREAAVTTVNELIENATIENGVKFVKNTAENINDYSIETAEELIEGVTKGGKEWQKLVAKTIKGGVALYGEQQDMVLTTLESLKQQYANGTFRLKNLLKFDFSAAEEVIETVTEKAKATAQKAVDAVSGEINPAKKATAKVAKKVTKPVAKKATIKVAKPAAKKVAAKKATAKKTAAKVTKSVAKKATATAKAVKPAAKKTTAKKATTATKITRNNLRDIEGIGPKIEELLNKGGIYTFQQLAEAKQGTLKGILAAGGSRYKMHDPATWGKQAALAAAGKREELKQLQAKLKGGKVAK